MSSFEGFPKIPRWNREVVITEKIDGTNAAIIIEEENYVEADDFELASVGGHYVFAQSRNRLIRPGVGKEAGNDNYGFSAWVQENAEELVNLLGPGRHFGEWYGKGIARNYGLDHRRFALFNTGRWVNLSWDSQQIHPSLPVDVVPILRVLERPSQHEVEAALDDLNDAGSFMVPGFMRPEGIVIFHKASNHLYKVTLEKDEQPKGQVAA